MHPLDGQVCAPQLDVPWAEGEPEEATVREPPVLTRTTGMITPVAAASLGRDTSSVLIRPSTPPPIPQTSMCAGQTSVTHGGPSMHLRGLEASAGVVIRYHSTPSGLGGVGWACLGSKRETEPILGRWS